jgi:hypothetical protein
MPSDGRMIEQIEEAWGGVDEANIENKRWNLQQLRTQKRCALKAESFKQKVASHTSWTDGKVEELQADDYSGAPLGTIAALIKKLEAFESDRLARETRVHEIGTIAAELDDAAYGDAVSVNNVYAEVYQTWNDITQVTEERAAKLAEALAKAEKLEAIWLDIATRAAPLMAFLSETKSALTAPIIAESEEDVQVERTGLEEVKANLQAFDTDYSEYVPSFPPDSFWFLLSDFGPLTSADCAGSNSSVTTRCKKRRMALADASRRSRPVDHRWSKPG